MTRGRPAARVPGPEAVPAPSGAGTPPPPSDDEPIRGELLGPGLLETRARQIAADRFQYQLEEITTLWDRTKDTKYAGIRIRLTTAQARVGVVSGTIGGLAADAIDLALDGAGRLLVTRSCYAGGVIATVRVDKDPQLATVRPMAFARSEPSGLRIDLSLRSTDAVCGPSMTRTPAITSDRATTATSASSSISP